MSHNEGLDQDFPCPNCGKELDSEECSDCAGTGKSRACVNCGHTAHNGPRDVISGESDEIIAVALDGCLECDRCPGYMKPEDDTICDTCLGEGTVWFCSNKNCR